MTAKDCKNCEELEKKLQKEIAYYKNIAKQSGIRRLREQQELNNVIRELKATREELKGAQEELEKRVEERTSELSIANEKLKTEIEYRQAAQELINKMNEELEDKVAERTVELYKINNALQESMDILKQTQEKLIESEKHAALSTLVVGVAHEINTPIGVSITAASYLDEKSREIISHFKNGTMKRSDLERYFEKSGESTLIIMNNLQRAADLIKSFKLVAVDQQHEESRAFDIKKYLEQILMNLRPELKKTGHIIEVNCPANMTINSNPGALSQILTNLIMNSMVHGFEDKDYGRIIIKIIIEHNRLYLHYSDDGKGMEKLDVKRVFEPFYTTKRGQGGTGLGMHVVYNLVTQSLKGEIDCVSLPEVGVRFYITFPVEVVNRNNK